MKITTWNVNGIRSLPKPISEVVGELDSDILCLQETKVPRDSLQSQVAFVEGFLSFFSFCRKKAGYSGVVTYSSSDSCPHSPEETFASSACESDVGISDYEGRVMITRHTFRPRNCPSNHHTSDLYLFNMYCPRFDPENPERFSYKMKFHRLMERKVRELLSRGSHVLLTGDFNVSLSRKDHCDPDSMPDFDEQEHRVWLRSLLAASDSSTESPILIDLFRRFHADEENTYTCWNTKISARETNFGTRIDYFIADKALGNGPLTRIRALLTARQANQTAVPTLQRELQDYRLSIRDIGYMPGYAVIAFWNNNARTLPTLSRIALSVATTPATSASCERAFSIAGHIVGVRRTRLSDTALSNAVLLHLSEHVETPIDV